SATPSAAYEFAPGARQPPAYHPPRTVLVAYRTGKASLTLRRWDWHRELICDGRVDIDVRAGRANRHQQRVSGRAIPALQARLLFPPPAHRGNTNGVPICKRRGAPTPDV